MKARCAWETLPRRESRGPSGGERCNCCPPIHCGGNQRSALISRVSMRQLQRRWACPRKLKPGRWIGCRAANVSGLRCCAPWIGNRACSSSTNPPPTWTRDRDSGSKRCLRATDGSTAQSARAGADALSRGASGHVCVAAPHDCDRLQDGAIVEIHHERNRVPDANGTFRLLEHQMMATGFENE